MTAENIMEGMATAVFGGGCFWCMQPPFDSEPGVVATEVGYMGGHVEHPSYQQVSSGMSGHVEVIRVTYNPAVVGYERLLEIFWHNIDPTQLDGQFADRGSQYRTVIFVSSEQQRQLARASKKALEESGKFNAPIAVTIESASAFYAAEDYHQNYYQKASEHYGRYKEGSGRAAFIREKWEGKG